jgi:antitoxin MazE
VRSKIERKGRDAIIRIPTALMSAAGLSMARTVNVRGESGRIIIEKLPGSEYDLEQLVSRITPKNRHREIDFGPAPAKTKKR